MSFLVFLHFICLTDEPEFSHNLDHMKNIFEVDMPFYNECVHFTIQQTNNENLQV